MVGSLVPYCFKTPRLLFIFYQKLLGLAKLRSKSIARNLSKLKLVLILLAILISFSSLAIFGGGGILWVTNSRDAYISNRDSVGPLYSLTQWLIMFAFIYYIFATKAKSIKLISSLIFFTCLMFFLGSKGNIIALTVVAVSYSNFYVKKIPNFAILLGVSLLFVGSLFLLIVQSSYSDLSDSILYFKDYFDTTAQMMSRFDEFGGFHYGGGLLSSLWFFVPRWLYPNKPYEYGETLIHQVLFPGAAETGNTPGLLPWSLIYLDFGIVGVFFWGFFISLFQKTCYEYFLKNRESFFAFSLGINFSIWNIWIFAPPIFVLILSALQSIFLKSIKLGK
jgi:oligosaccharide repeat unit polymerase